MKKQLYTIGHSTHTIEKFLKLLKGTEIQVVCDVRSQPYSRFNPQFNKETLQKALNKIGIKYIFLGRELGARSENEDCYIDNKVQFERLKEEPKFKEGLLRLEKGLENFKIALMCAEKDPITCHRMILVSYQLRNKNININHILETGDVEDNEDAENRMMKLLKIESDLFLDREQLIKKAYRLQSEAVAYVKVEKDSLVG